jgi:hypothetical protein
MGLEPATFGVTGRRHYHTKQWVLQRLVEKTQIARCRPHVLRMNAAIRLANIAAAQYRYRAATRV